MKQANIWIGRRTALLLCLALTGTGWGQAEKPLDISSPHDEGTATTIGGVSSIVPSTEKAATAAAQEDTVMDLINRVSTRPAHTTPTPITMPSIDATEIPRPVEEIRPPPIDEENNNYEAYAVIGAGIFLLLASGIWQLMSRKRR